ncbi:MAG TPA: type VI secretion system baseplate protein TssE [Dysgonomonas sp.]|nr:type VI secretion system baseplate protein TssE [Dysgonomonas sp.]
MKFYKLPLYFTKIFESDINNLETCSEKESIDQNLELILTTCPGEHKYDPDFGCRIWDLDFEKVVSRSRWKEQFLQFIDEAVSKYEPRIDNVSPNIDFFDTKEVFELSGATSIRKRVDIKIDARIISTGALCCFYYSLYLGPLSSD